MADTQDKTVGIKFSVDTASADKARRVIQSLVEDVNKLVDATGKINFGGMGGGGARVSSISGKGGGGNIGTQMSQKAGGATNGVVDGLTRAVTQSSALFKGASTGAIGSFKIMGDSLREMVGKSEREISRLEGSLSKLERTFTKLKDRPGVGKGGFTDRAISANQSEYFSQVGQLSEANAAKKAFAADLRSMNPTFGDKAKAFFGIPQGGFPAGTNPMSMIGSVAGSPAGAISAGVALGMKIAMPLAASANSFESGNLGYAMDSPMINLQNRASIGGTYGGLAVALRGGAVSKATAMNRLLQNGQIEQILGKEYFENAVAKTKTDIRTGVFDNLGAGSLGGAKDAFVQKMGRIWSQNKLGGKGVVDDAATALTLKELSLKRAIQGAPAEAAQRLGQALSLEEQSNPYQNQIVNDIYANAFSDIAGQNASRTSGLRTYNKKTKTWNIDYDLFKARQESGGWDPGLVMGKMGSLSDVLGRRLSGSGIAKGILSSELGGLSSAGGIFSAGSQFGGGLAGGNGLTAVIQGLIGRGKHGGNALDIGAGSSIGNLVSQTMLSGNFRGGGEGGFASTLLNAAYTGNTGTQMFNARAMGAGLGAMNSFATGGLDPLQGAVNMSAAISAARNAPWQTKKILMSLDSASLLDIMKTGTIPSHLARTGITVDMVRAYVSSRNGMSFARVNDVMLTAGGRSAVGQYRSQGIGFLKGMSKSGREQALTDLANASIVGTGHTFEADYEMFRIEAAGAGILGGPAGRGAHRSASMKSQQGHAARARGANTKGLGADKAAPGTNAVVEAGLAATPGMVNPLDTSGQAMVAALGTQTSIETHMNEKLGQIVSLMSQLVELNNGHAIVGTGKGGPKKSVEEAEDVDSSY